MAVKYEGAETDERYSVRRHVAFECVVCRTVIGGLVKQPSSGYAGPAEVLAWWPKGFGVVEFPDVPHPLVAATASEAYLCREAGALRGALALARAAIEAAAKSFAIEDGQVMQKIDAMADRGLISTRIKDAAHAIRGASNRVLHGDLVEPPTAEQVDDALALMSMVLDDAFGVSARIDRLKTTQR
jgi:hypothetical protein